MAPRSAAGGTVKMGLKVEAVPSMVATGELDTVGNAAGEVAPRRLWLPELEDVVSTSGLCAALECTERKSQTQ